MALRSAGRKLSFEILGRSSCLEEDESLFYQSESYPTQNGVEEPQSPASMEKPNRKKRKHKGPKKTKKTVAAIHCSIPEDPIIEKRIDSGSIVDEPKYTETFSADRDCCSAYGLDLVVNYQSCSVGTVFCEDFNMPEESTENVCAVMQTVAPEFQNLRGERFNFGELRQRTVNVEDAAPMIDIDGNEQSRTEGNAECKQRSEPNGSTFTRSETAESLDWKQLMAEDPHCIFPVEKSPVKYFMEEMLSGNSLRRTTTSGNEKERERVYDTIFRLPWRCELLIDVGFFVCIDSFLSLLTIMPTRMVIAFWGLLKMRQFQRPSTEELSDFGCLVIMAFGVTLLQWTDISLIYHMIRGQGTFKLYVVYNVLEIFDKLCQSIGGDVLQTLFNSSEGLANCPPENFRFWILRFIFDQVLAIAASIVHSFILLAQAITLSTCIVAHNNALLALLVSNNFAEIKSNVFKRFSKDNIHNLVYVDSVERFHISAFVIFVLAQNILEAEGPWFQSFFFNVLMVYVCEMVIDIIKHSFLAKFNGIKPTVYSEFLEDLCKQTLNIQSEDAKKNLTFVPLAPACVVIRVLTPVYAALLPCKPLPWRLFSAILLIGVTYVMLTSLKVMIGIGLKKHAAWYVERCRKRKHHLHSD